MPFAENKFDVIISNCVLNLVPDKEKAFSEIYRVLRPGGHFCVSDVVIKGKLPKKIRQDAAMYVGCVAGALQKDVYFKIIREKGFSTISIHKEERTVLPDSLLQKYLSETEMNDYKNGEFGIENSTVSGKK